MVPLITVFLLLISNIFMTFAWYGHLKNLSHKPILAAIVVSWVIAFFEYCFQVPANRIGYGYFTLPQLKIIQEALTLVVFLFFAVFYMRVKLTLNFVWACFCIVGAVYFIFKDRVV